MAAVVPAGAVACHAVDEGRLPPPSGIVRPASLGAKDDPESPIPTLEAVRYDFRLAHAEAGDTGRVGADPSKLMKAAE